MTHRRKWLLAAGVAGLCGAGVPVRGMPAAAAAQKKSAAVETSALAADKGKLRILLDGQPIGAEEFEIAPSGGVWVAHSSVEIKTADAAPVRVTSSLQLQPDGSPRSYEWTSQAGKKSGAHIVFENGVAKITLEMEGTRPFQQELTFANPKIAVLDNNVYHHYAILARLYDWSRRGAQSFPVLIPQDLTPGTITAEATGEQSAGGQSYEGLRVTTPDIEVLVFLDANHRLMRLEVPAAKVAVTRE